jgi:uncharacterized protein YchJ
MNDYLKDIEDLQVALTALQENANDKQNIGLQIIERMITDKQEAIVKFEQELEDLSNAVQ